MIGNGFCNVEIDTVECNYDGGDCCGLCPTIIVTLEGNALAAVGNMEGVYHISSMVNGKESWTSTYKAIWFYQLQWSIGSLEYIGEISDQMYARSNGNQCPFNLLSEKWKYVNNGWKAASADEIKIQCLRGNLSALNIDIKTFLHMIQLLDLVFSATKDILSPRSKA